MKKLVVLVLLLSSFIGFSQYPLSLNQERELYKLHKVKERKGESATLYFDLEGRITMKRAYFVFEVGWNELKYFYNEKGILTGIIEQNVYVELTKRSAKRLIKAGQIPKDYTLPVYIPLNIYTVECDDSLVTKITKYLRNKNLSSIEYYKDGQLTKKDSYLENKLYQKTTYEYNDKNLLVKKVIDSFGAVKYKVNFDYVYTIEDGIVKQCKIQRKSAEIGKNSIDKCTYRYYDNGLLFEIQGDELYSDFFEYVYY